MEVGEHHGLREGAAVPCRGEDARVHREPGAAGPGAGGGGVAWGSGRPPDSFQLQSAAGLTLSPGPQASSSSAAGAPLNGI